jgi:hypothetical protein
MTVTLSCGGSCSSGEDGSEGEVNHVDGCRWRSALLFCIITCTVIWVWVWVWVFYRHVSTTKRKYAMQRTGSNLLCSLVASSLTS